MLIINHKLYLREVFSQISAEAPGTTASIGLSSSTMLTVCSSAESSSSQMVPAAAAAAALWLFLLLLERRMMVSVSGPRIISRIIVDL